MSSWFDASAGRPLFRVLQECMSRSHSGVIDVVGRAETGQVFFAARHVLLVTTDDRLPLRTTLELSGAADADELADLARTARPVGPVRRVVPPAVSAVVRDLSEASFASLMSIQVGSAKVEPGEVPPLGVLMSVRLEELAAAAEILPIRERAAALPRRAASAAGYVAGSAPEAEEVPVQRVVTTGRASALRRLIGAVRAG